MEDRGGRESWYLFTSKIISEGPAVWHRDNTAQEKLDLM